MIKKISIFLLLAGFALTSCEIKNEEPKSIGEIITALKKSAKENGDEKVWEEFISKYQVPLTIKDSVAFFYHGSAENVQWAGDFNSWSQSEPKAIGEEIENSQIWYAIINLPPDARIDYKIIVDGNWILDPINSNKQMTGVGGGTYNSELRMPEWTPDTVGYERSNIPHGRIEYVSLESKSMGYKINYQVYTPAGYEEMQNLPSIYVTDGQEYNHPEMGNMINQVDNLIYDKKIEPIIIVLIDPRNPENEQENRRMTELVLNDNYLKFVTEDLIPVIDRNYKTTASADNRAILGTSLGGLNSAFFAVKASDKFHLVGINSPAFEYKQDIYDLYEKSETLPLKIIMTTGVVHDTEVGARKMKEIMDGKNYPLKYIEINQGHSWGNWSELLDDVLIYLFGSGQPLDQ